MKIISPLLVILPRKTKADKRIYLNLNAYRNLHYISNNQAKHIYCELMEKQLKGKVFKTPIELEFKFFKKTKRRTDRSNILSIVEKFFCDAMVNYECIPDDSDEFILSSYYISGHIDKDNPRVEIIIKEYESNTTKNEKRNS